MPYIGQYAELFDTRRVGTIASTRARGQCHLLCFASRTKVSCETPAKILEQCIELFGNPGNNLLSTAIIFSPWFFRVVKRNLAGLFLTTIPTNRIVVFFYLFVLFERQLGSKLAKNPRKT